MLLQITVTDCCVEQPGAGRSPANHLAAASQHTASQQCCYQSALWASPGVSISEQCLITVVSVI